MQAPPRDRAAANIPGGSRGLPAQRADTQQAEAAQAQRAGERAKLQQRKARPRRRLHRAAGARIRPVRGRHDRHGPRRGGADGTARQQARKPARQPQSQHAHVWAKQIKD